MSLSVSCPECGTSLEVDDEYRDWKVRCPRCRHEFQALESPAAVPVRDQSDGEEMERPRRRRRRKRDDDDDAWVDPEAGAREIANPAATLEILGWVSLVFALLACAVLVAYGISQANNQPQPPANGPNRAKDDDPVVLIFVGFCVGILALPYFGLIAFGARKMRNLSSHGWAMTSAIMAIAALPLFGICGLPIFGPGIWALVVMNHLNVKAAFKRRRRRGRRDDYEDDDDDD